MGRGGYPLTRPYLSRYPITVYTGICWANKGQKMTDLQDMGQVSQITDGTGVRPAPIPTFNELGI